MAKAQLTTKLGTKVTIEGTSEEIAELLARFECEAPSSRANSSTGHNSKPSRAKKVLEHSAIELNRL